MVGQDSTQGWACNLVGENKHNGEKCNEDSKDGDVVRSDGGRNRDCGEVCNGLGGDDLKVCNGYE